MRKIDDDSRPIHLADNGFAERRKSAVDRRFGLYVADLIDMVVHDGDGANAIAKGLVHAIEAVFDEVSTLDREHCGGPAVALRAVDVRRVQSLGQRMTLDQGLEFGELPLVIRVRLARLVFPGGMQPCGGRHFQQAHVRHRGNQHAAHGARVEISDRAIFEGRAESACGRGFVRKILQKEPAGVRVRIHGGMAAQEGDACRPLLRMECHS